MNALAFLQSGGELIFLSNFTQDFTQGVCGVKLRSYQLDYVAFVFTTSLLFASEIQVRWACNLVALTSRSWKNSRLSHWYVKKQRDGFSTLRNNGQGVLQTLRLSSGEQIHSIDRNDYSEIFSFISYFYFLGNLAFFQDVFPANM